MSTGAALAILLLAALFEAGGDALIRAGLHSTQWRWLPMLAGAAALFGYGVHRQRAPLGFRPAAGRIHSAFLRHCADDCLGCVWTEA